MLKVVFTKFFLYTDCTTGIKLPVVIKTCHEHYFSMFIFFPSIKLTKVRRFLGQIAALVQGKTDGCNVSYGSLCSYQRASKSGEGGNISEIPSVRHTFLDLARDAIPTGCHTQVAIPRDATP